MTMPRSVKEWIGKTADTQAPPKVRLRNFTDHGGVCHLCSGKILAGDKWETDHVTDLWKGGENRETNLAPAHKRCHDAKSREGKSQKAVEDRKRRAHLGIKAMPRQKIKSRGFAKREPQRNASRPLRLKKYTLIDE